MKKILIALTLLLTMSSFAGNITKSDLMGLTCTKNKGDITYTIVLQEDGWSYGNNHPSVGYTRSGENFAVEYDNSDNFFELILLNEDGEREFSIDQVLVVNRSFFLKKISLTEVSVMTGTHSDYKCRY